jgi:hypothetical protein
MDECNKLMAAEAQHVSALLVDPLLPLTEDPGAMKKEFKSLCKLRSNCDSWSDKVAANERKDVPSGKGDDAMVQLIDARVQYRHGLLDYVENVKKGHRDLRSRVCKQLLEFWISRHSEVRSVEKTMVDVQPHMVSALVHEEETTSVRREQERREGEERCALEGSDNFAGFAVCHNNFLQGWLWHRSSGKLGTWIKRFFRVKDGMMRSFGEGENVAIALVTARVRPIVGEVDRRRCFSVMGPSDELLLQASSQQELELWQKVIELETVRLLSGNSAEKAAFSCGEQRAGGSAPLERLYEADASNAFCADCGTAAPEWAAINLGVLFCITCSGVHRSMGVHISKVTLKTNGTQNCHSFLSKKNQTKVRSFRLDSWSDGELAVLQRLGNAKVSRTLLEARPGPEKPTPDSPAHVREAYLQAKYVRREMLAPVPLDVTGSLDEALQECVSSGSLERMLHLLLLGASPASVGGCSALVRAAQSGDLGALELLLLHGADPKAKDGAGVTALHAAATRGDVQMASALFKRGCDPDAQDAQGRTPAQLAAQAGNADCVTLLRLASLSAAEGEGMRGDFAALLEEFSRNLAERREKQHTSTALHLTKQ